MPRSYPPEFRRRVLDLVASGRKVAEVAQLLGVSDQTICNWRRRHLIDTGQIPGTTSSDQAELASARKRIAEPETELAIHRRAAELLGEATRPKGGTKPSA
ncbi:transposase [Streptomyces caelestis]|uniref:Transposase n=1 Tax=Streptomyces caelestis TaxID=36816 RepID=A0A0M8QP43_9ACTN|nr:transposase [Streptomyces caelestis]